MLQSMSGFLELILIMIMNYCRVKEFPSSNTCDYGMLRSHFLEVILVMIMGYCRESLGFIELRDVAESGFRRSNTRHDYGILQRVTGFLEVILVMIMGCCRITGFPRNNTSYDYGLLQRVSGFPRSNTHYGFGMLQRVSVFPRSNTPYDYGMLQRISGFPRSNTTHVAYGIPCQTFDSPEECPHSGHHRCWCQSSQAC